MSDDKNTPNLNEHIDHQRWLLEHGFVNDLHKDNLFMYGSLIHKEVKAVQVDINIETKLVSYDIYVPKSLLNRISKYEELSGSRSIIGLWRFKKMLQKEGNLNLKHLLSSFVNDYCGPKWSVDLKLKDFRDYDEGFEELQRDDEADKQPDSG